MSKRPTRRAAASDAVADDLPPIHLRGVRTHNLKNFTVDIPAGRLTVVTGVSGSGKSSLAFDTMYAEGQRRYVESLSTYARQFLARMARPEADRIDHIPPAIALEQKNTVRNARSTVGTATEINDYLRLLFGKVGEVRCPDCGETVRRTSPQEAARLAREHFGEGARLLIIAPVPVPEKGTMAGLIEALRKQGHTRIVSPDGEVEESDDPAFRAPKGSVLPVLMDRVVLKAGVDSRLSAAVEHAYGIAHGWCELRERDGRSRRYASGFVCGTCARSFREPEPRLFNFNNPLGACPECQGFGRVSTIDWNKVVPNPALSLSQGCIAPWNGESGQEMYDLFATKNKGPDRVPRNVPFRDLTKEQQELILQGKGDWPGVAGFFRWLESRTYKVQARIMIARFRRWEPCPKCNGSRLVADANFVRFGGRSFGELTAMNITDLSAWFDALKLPKHPQEAVERPLSETRHRLLYLLEVGLGYLTLDRQTRTLSGGEAQRINLASALGSALTETLYVLDEPTVGLHARDTHRLIGILRRLTDAGNTVTVVEHDLDVMRAADWLLDIGPKAGEQGGELVYAGKPDALTERIAPKSQTARFLEQPSGAARKKAPASAKKTSTPPIKYRRTPERWITILDATENNLRNLTVRIPLGVLCCVTGVSGSGKSSLIKTCLHGNYCRGNGDVSVEAGTIGGLHGTGQISDMLLIDQSPIGRSTRSNPATFLKAYDGIRDLLASMPDAKERGLRPGDFSFNIAGGRCETCEGTGTQTVEMLFLADVEVTCETCEGQRFQERVLGVTWNGKNVNAILEMTVEEAVQFFAGQRKILSGLRPLLEVGLGYLRLGQSTATLSGGEAQRLKIAGHLSAAEAQNNMLLLFDEPTTGLHPADLEVLAAVFDRLLERGFSLVVIEHNLELIRRADWVLDLGPEGGEGGGHLIAEGTPEEIMACKESLTGRYLRG